MTKMIKKVLAIILAVLTFSVCFAGCSSAIMANQNQEEIVYTNTFLDSAQTTCTVTIDYHQTGKANSVYTVTNGQTMQKPSNPTYNSNTFINWYCKGEVFDWSTPITEDITINAVWKKTYSNALTARTGSMTKSNNNYTSSGSALYVNENADFDQGTIQVSVKASSSADSGIVFGLTGNGKTSYWEDSGVSYYFLFIARGGTISLGKVNNTGKGSTWTSLDSYKISGFTSGQSYNLKLVLSGTEACCYVNDKLYLIFSERYFLQGKGFGLRAGGADITFNNFTVSGDCLY